jgi:NTE family protein
VTGGQHPSEAYATDGASEPESRPTVATAALNPTTTAYGFHGYLALPKEHRRGVALCLSGGGYRAALFHLGALRRLNELGVLSQVDTITSVSGGSIIAAQLASHRRELGDDWPDTGSCVPRWDEGVAEPLRAFVGTDIRTGAVLRRAAPRHWLNKNASVDGLANRYAEGPARGKLSDLPDHPRFVFCATNMQFRSQWVFDCGRRIVGDDQAGFCQLTDDWTLARAVAASSCVPGVFTPMQVATEPSALKGGLYRGADRAGLVRNMEIVDGGLYDNLGLEPVWRDHAVVLVSDAAPSFKPEPDIGVVSGLLRSILTLCEQATDVRKRWFVANLIAGELEGAYWGIGSLPSSFDFDSEAYDPQLTAYSEEAIGEVLSQVRIDLDVFSDPEIAVLENHGYLMAEIAVRRHVPHLCQTPHPAPQVPHPEWMDDARVASALDGSAVTRLFSRRFTAARRRG